MDEIPPVPPHPADDDPPPRRDRSDEPDGRRTRDDWADPDRAPDRTPATTAPSALLRDLGDAHQALQAELLAAYLETMDWGGTPAADGMTPDQLLVLQAGVDRATVALLRAAARNRRRLPSVLRATLERTLTLNELATIARTTSRLPRGAHLARIDARVAAAAIARDDGRPLDAGPVRLARWLTREALRELAGADRDDAADDAQLERNRVTARLDLEGRGQLLADLDPEAFTLLLGAIEDAAGPPRPDTARPRQLAEGLLALATGADAGAGSGRRVRRQVVATLDLTAATAAIAGTWRTPLAQAAPTLTARVADLLADGSDLLVQLTDGRNPLAELRDAAEVPAATRRAVLARDGGCRFPGCAAPPGWTDVHHLRPRAAGGTHEPENLAALCRRDHRRLHRQGWQARLDPTTAVLTWTRDNPDGTTTVLTSAAHTAHPGGLRSPVVAAA